MDCCDLPSFAHGSIFHVRNARADDLSAKFTAAHRTKANSHVRVGLMLSKKSLCQEAWFLGDRIIALSCSAVPALPLGSLAPSLLTQLTQAPVQVVAQVAEEPWF